MTSQDEGTPGRILVVDDDLVTGQFLTYLLGDRGGFDVTHTPIRRPRWPGPPRRPGTWC